jgi:hypothetical protein
MCAALLVAAILFQKVAVPGSGGLVGVSLAALACACGYGLLTGQLVVATTTLAAFVAFVLLAALSAVASTAVGLSTLSLAFLMVVQVVLALRFVPGALDYGRLLDLAGALISLTAALGIAQFLAQFALGPAIPFALDLAMPPAVALDGFNQLIPLSYGSPYLKSNGVVFAEPSFFSQFLAIGVVIELARRCRPSRLALYAGALVCSYSGTGLFVLAIFAPLYLMRRRVLPLLGLGVLAGAVAVLAGDPLQLGLILERADEFGQPGSSGHARFVSPFAYIHEGVVSDPVAFVLGRGPGTVTESFELLPYTAFDPTWAKLFYEYGCLGFLAYMLFFASAVAGARRRALAGPLVVTYFLLGGYAQNPFVVTTLAVLLVWTAGQEETPAGARPRR